MHPARRRRCPRDGICGTAGARPCAASHKYNSWFVGSLTMLVRGDPPPTHTHQHTHARRPAHARRGARLVDDPGVRLRGPHDGAPLVALLHVPAVGPSAFALAFAHVHCAPPTRTPQRRANQNQNRANRQNVTRDRCHTSNPLRTAHACRYSSASPRPAPRMPRLRRPARQPVHAVARRVARAHDPEARELRVGGGVRARRGRGAQRVADEAAPRVRALEHGDAPELHAIVRALARPRELPPQSADPARAAGAAAAAAAAARAPSPVSVLSLSRGGRRLVVQRERKPRVPRAPRRGPRGVHQRPVPIQPAR